MWGRDFGNIFCLLSWAVGRDKLLWLGVNNSSDNPLSVSTRPPQHPSGATLGGPALRGLKKKVALTHQRLPRCCQVP